MLAPMNRRHLLRALATAALPLGLLAGCGSDTKTAATPTATTPTAPTAASSPTSCPTTPAGAAPAKKSYPAPPAMAIDVAKTYTAKIATSFGAITIALDAKAAPKTVNNFVFLACQRFYDGLTWHRVVKGFVIQGGDPQGTGSGDAGYSFEDELPTDGYPLGSVAMANSGPNTNGSQFFIVTGDASFLENNYSKFGKVTSGLDAAKKIEALANPDDPTGAPRKKALIDSVTITEG
jgi:cyclophilin family peptidyl-prolyl cis-trans isomerase